MILAEFMNRLEKILELTSRALPCLDEDDRLTSDLGPPFEKLRHARRRLLRVRRFARRRTRQRGKH